MTPIGQTRLQVFNSLLAQQMTLDQAATVIGVSPRHPKRILAAYRDKGAPALAHGLRDRRAQRMQPSPPKRVGTVEILRTRYSN